MQKAALSLLVILLLSFLAVPTHGREAFIYVNPRPGASLVQVHTSITVGHGEKLSLHSNDHKLFHVVGSLSGEHSGNVILSDDQRTLIFTPSKPFTANEIVSVTITPGIRTSRGQHWPN